MNIDTTTLHCFLAVAETGSFTKAAEKVCRTQSAISQQMAKLENLLGRQLLVRDKTIKLTAEGEVFLAYARRIFELHHEVFDYFKAPALEGDVRFGLPEDFASVYLADVLTDFTRLHPRVILNVECDLTLNLFERFKRKQFDVVLVKMSHPKDFPNGIEVWSEPLKWVGNKELLESTKPIPLVLSPQPCVYRAGALKALEAAGLKWRVVFSSTSYASTIAAVKAGMGITVLPQTMVPMQLNIIHCDYLTPLQDIHVSLLKDRSDNLVINSLESFVIKKLRH